MVKKKKEGEAVKSKGESFKVVLEHWDPKDLTPYANNSKKHPTEQIDQIARQIHKYGFDVPISVDEKGVIIKGHGRRQAAIRLKMKTVPVIVRKDLDEYEKMAIRIADNKVAESEWDKEFLKFELGTLSRNEFDLDDTGFSLDAIDKLLNEDEVEDERKDKTIKNIYEIVVVCSGESNQKDVYDKLTAQGFECRVLSM